MNLNTSPGSAAGRVLVPAAITLAIVVGLLLFWKSGLFAQIGRVATVLLIAGDAFVVGLVWFRALR